MRLNRILGVIVLGSTCVAGVVSAQQAPASKFKPLRNATPHVKERPTNAINFGGVNVQYQRISAMQFTSDVSSDSYTSTWDPGFTYAYQRFFSSAGFNHLVSSPTLPGGARIVYAELDACDASTTDEHVQLNVWNCGYDGDCSSTPLVTLTSTSDTVTPCSSWSDSSLSQRVDNYFGQTLLDVTMDATNGTNSLAGVIVGYVLEVSPAPGTATFLDVPTSHPFFQFIEALAEAGVTGGCGSGNYCPDNPVTRGQMAVFMSKLTGLSWNGY